MIVNEQKTVRERCIDHLETILGVPVDKEKLRFDLGKKQVVIADVQLFHEIAQVTGLRELKRGRASVWYNLQVSNGLTEVESYCWMVTLPSHLNQDFLRNYGGGYRFR